MHTGRCDAQGRQSIFYCFFVVLSVVALPEIDNPNLPEKREIFPSCSICVSFRAPHVNSSKTLGQIDNPKLKVSTLRFNKTKHEYIRIFYDGCAGLARHETSGNKGPWNPPPVGGTSRFVSVALMTQAKKGLREERLTSF